MPRILPARATFYSQLQNLTPATLIRLTEPGQARPRTIHMEQFTGIVRHTDGSLITYLTSLPLQLKQELVKDTVHHAVWNPRIRDAQLDKSSEEFLKFRKRFGDGSMGSCPTSAASSDENADKQTGAGDDDLVDIYADLSFSEEGAGVVEVRSKYATSSSTNQQRKK